MDNELNQTEGSTLLQSFERLVNKNNKNANENDLDHDHDSDEQSDNQDQEQEVDVDMNLLKNFLESYSAQLGQSGPTSQLLSQLGLSLPRAPPVYDKPNK